MSYNFVSWEITQMLPLYNLISKESESEFLIFNNETENCTFTRTDYYEPQESYVPLYSVRQAYTWEDVRLYLESKGYIITVLPYIDKYGDNETQLLWEYSILFTSTYEIEPDMEYYHSYQEAREEAVKYVLNLINNDGTK